jgi:hypothetical protein
MPRGQKLTVEQREEIFDAFIERKLNRREIAEMYTIEPTTVNRVVREMRQQNTNSNGDLVVIRKIPVESLVTIDAQETVIEVKPLPPSKATNLGEWEVKFSGSIIVEAESIDMALHEARKLGMVKRIYSAHLKGK